MFTTVRMTSAEGELEMPEPSRAPNVAVALDDVVTMGEDTDSFVAELEDTIGDLKLVEDGVEGAADGEETFFSSAAVTEVEDDLEGIEVEEYDIVEVVLEYRSWMPRSVFKLIRREVLNLLLTRSDDSKSCEACMPITRHMFK